MSSAKKKYIRNGHRTLIKKLIGEYEGLITVNMAKIVAVQRSLIEKRDVAKKLDDEETSVFSDIINRALADIDVTLTVKVDATLQTKSRMSGDLNTSIFSGKQSVRLLILEIPTFSGDQIEYRGFCDQFSSSCCNNDDLSDIDKFCYLGGVLKGPALDLISGLSLSSSNYVMAVETIKVEGL